MVIKNENYKSCLVSNFGTISYDLQVRSFFYFNSIFSFINRIFVLPYYESAIVEQNLLLNKRQKDDTEMKG
jgi:hypothetical protein